jgi:hypothetical protein
VSAFVPAPSRVFDRRLYTASAVVAAIVVLVGFSRTFYLRAWFETPPLSALRYVHGALMTLWYSLFLVQVTLVSRRRIDLHRRIGVLASVIALALVAAGILTAVDFVTRMRPNPDEATGAAAVAGFDFVSLLVFSLLVAAALALRRRSDTHKRLMTLASLSLLGPPLARLVSDQQAVWLTYLFVLLPIVIDTWRNRRLHPAFAWGGLTILLSTQMALHYVVSASWIDFALRTFP